jgi:excisionase family DNA binding protein
MEPLAVDVREASRLTSLSVRTIRRYIASGQLRAARLGRRVVVPLEAIRVLIGEAMPSESDRPIPRNRTKASDECTGQTGL